MKKNIIFLLCLLTLVIFLLLSPKLFSIIHFQDYLNLQNGNIITEHSVCGFTYYAYEHQSELSSDMSLYSQKLPYRKMLIRERHGLERLNLKKAKCYVELKLLFMVKKANNSIASIQEIISIIEKYP